MHGGCNRRKTTEIGERARSEETATAPRSRVADAALAEGRGTYVDR